MEDIIPMTILTVLMADVSDVKAHIDMANDFSTCDLCDQEAESVGRMLVNVSVTVTIEFRSRLTS